MGALALLLMALAFLLLRRIVRRAFSRSYRLPPQEVDLEDFLTQDGSQGLSEG
tara:strand:+ start:191 stop:349 length:159 start_codon:yes stop_codon:yes gene_type:complete